MIKWITIILAVVGMAVGTWVVLSTAEQEPPNPPPDAEPSINPYENGIAATGVVEPRGRDIAIAPPEAGLVTEVMARVNERIERGQPLFRLDQRDLEAERLRARAAVEVQEAQLAQLRALPRPEDLPALEARVERAQAAVRKTRDDYQRLQEVYEGEAATPRELSQARLAYEEAEAELAEARAALAEAQAGAWEYEIRVAEAQLEQARAEVRAINQRIERRLVRSPITGTVLKREIEPGEYADPAAEDAAMVVGHLDQLHVRAQVDEENLPRLRYGVPAVARVRGAAEEMIPLRMLRIEPLAIPKTQLTGAPSELVDTRVIEVIFEVEEDEYDGPASTREGEPPLYPGQVVDVFIRAEPRPTRDGPEPSPAADTDTPSPGTGR